MSSDRSRGTQPPVRIREESPRREDQPLDWPGDPELLTVGAVDFEALAYVLANTCRRGGRLRRFHSLAVHAVLMSEAIEDLGEPGAEDAREAALHALLAGSSAAWLGAEPASSQRGAERLQRVRAAVDRTVRESAGLDPEPSPEQAELLRFVVRMAEASEDRDLPGARDGEGPAVVFPPLKRRIRTVEPERAARLWLERFRSLREALGLGRSGIAPGAEPHATRPPTEPGAGGPHDED